MSRAFTFARPRALVAALVRVSIAATASVAAAQQQQGRTPPDSNVRARWDVTEARGTTREIDFTTSEGTWMSIDPSPDMRWVYFDLLGQIYRLRTEGGEAESLTQNSGVAINFHPRVAPDGR